MLCLTVKVMRILYFHQYFSTPYGAIGTRSYEFARRLVAAGHDVCIVCGSFASAKTGLTGPFARGVRCGYVDGIRVLELELPYSNKDRFLRRTFTFLKFAQRSIRIAVRDDCDLVVASSTPLTAALPGIFARWFRRRKFVFEVRDVWPELPRAMGVITNPIILGVMSGLEWLAYSSAHGLVGLSPGIVESISRFPTGPKSVAMIPNGSDIDLFGDAEPADSLPKGIGRSDFVATFAGAHGIANGLDAVVDAAVELKRRGRSDIKILLVGDGACKRSHQSRTQKERLENIIFIDPLSKYDLARLFKRVQAGLMVLKNVPAFYRGTSPNKFFDYIAAGLPVVVNYPGWVADLVAANRCGVVLPPDCPCSFADALEALADDSVNRSRLGRNARKLAENEFSRHVLSVQFVEFLVDVCDAKATTV